VPNVLVHVPAPCHSARDKEKAAQTSGRPVSFALGNFIPQFLALTCLQTQRSL
jgi:hypothetical protein